MGVIRGFLSVGGRPSHTCCRGSALRWVSAGVLTGLKREGVVRPVDGGYLTVGGRDSHAWELVWCISSLGVSEKISAGLPCDGMVRPVDGGFLADVS